MLESYFQPPPSTLLLGVHDVFCGYSQIFSFHAHLCSKANSGHARHGLNPEVLNIVLSTLHQDVREGGGMGVGNQG